MAYWEVKVVQEGKKPDIWRGPSASAASATSRALRDIELETNQEVIACTITVKQGPTLEHEEEGE